MKNKFCIYILLFIFLCTSSFAQQYKAPLNYGGKNGLYLIPIPIEIRSVVSNNTDWLRIKDEAGNDAPYMIYRNDVESSQNFAPITSVISQRTDSSSLFIIPNTQKERNNLVLEIANSDVQKNFVLDGSNDQKQWFSLVNNGQLSELSSSTSTTIFKTISFPNSDYKYLRLYISDKNSAPLNIKNIGDWKEQLQEESFEPIPNVKFSVKNIVSEKSQIIIVNKNGLNPVEKIKIIFAQTGFFNRDIVFYSNKDVATSESQYSGTISNTSKNEFYISPITNNTFSIRIQNNDNPPLKIEHIELFEKPITLLAQLESDKKYNVLVDSSYRQPVYDLNKNAISNTSQLQNAQIGKLEKLTAVITTNPANNYGKYLLWIGIGIGVIALFFFGSKLLKDMNKNNS